MPESKPPPGGRSCCCVRAKAELVIVVFNGAIVLAGLRGFTQIKSRAGLCARGEYPKRLKGNACSQRQGLAGNLRHVEYSRPVSRFRRTSFLYRA